MHNAIYEPNHSIMNRTEWNKMIEQHIRVAVNVQDVLTRMPNRQHAEVIELMILRGMSAKNVAELWHTTAEHVNNIKYEAIKDFAENEG